MDSPEGYDFLYICANESCGTFLDLHCSPCTCWWQKKDIRSSSGYVLTHACLTPISFIVFMAFLLLHIIKGITKLLIFEVHQQYLNCSFDCPKSNFCNFSQFIENLGHEELGWKPAFSTHNDVSYLYCLTLLNLSILICNMGKESYCMLDRKQFKICVQ